MAAIAVMVMHIQPVLWPGELIPSGYLAVDFFFALSGFVLAHAYQQRLEADMGVLEFMRLRLIRLYPLFALGGVISFALGIQAFAHGNLEVKDMIARLANFAFIPVPAFHLYPLNFPAWSLAFELLINVIFAVFALRLRSTRMLIALIAVSWLALVVTAFVQGGLFGGVHKSDWWGGFSRVGFSFFVGVGLYRLQRTRTLALPSWSIFPVLAVLVATFLFKGGPVYDLAVVTVVYPALIMVGSRIPPPLPGVAAFLGDASYAVYVLHIPVRQIVRSVTGHFSVEPSPLIGVGFIVTMLVLAAVVDKIYDQPVRRWLNRVTRPPLKVAA